MTPSGKELSSADSSVSTDVGPIELAAPGTDPVRCTPGSPGVTVVSMRGVLVLMLFSAASTAAIAEARKSRDPGSPDSVAKKLLVNNNNR